MFKNLTIKQISFYIVTAIGAMQLLVIFIMVGPSYLLTNSVRVFVSFTLGLVASFVLINYLLERYVFRKIKVIYKIIHKSKQLKGDRTEIDLNNTTIENVNTEVIKWAESTEEKLRSLRSLAEYRKDFVGNISHELKTPIFSIQGYLHTLLDGGIHDEKVNVNFVKRAAANAERLQNIVEDLETIASLESGKILLELNKFDIRELVSEVLQDIRIVANSKNITVGFKEGASQGYMVRADRESIRQVLTNLLVNSIKYGRQEGTSKVSFYDFDRNVLVEVSDNGLGIEEAHLKHLFDRFYRVDKSRSRVAGGSGLGLSIVKHIIEAHQQTINVRSTVGVGSTFGFTLEKA